MNQIPVKNLKELLETAEDYADDHGKYREFLKHYKSFRVEHGIEFSVICAMQKVGLFDSFFKDKMEATVRRTQVLS